MVGPGYIMCDYMDAMMLKFKFLHLQVLFFQRHELYDMCSVGSKMALKLYAHLYYIVSRPRHQCTLLPVEGRLPEIPWLSFLQIEAQ